MQPHRGVQSHLQRLRQILPLEQSGERGDAGPELGVVEVGFGDEGLGVHLTGDGFAFVCVICVLVFVGGVCVGGTL